MTENHSTNWQEVHDDYVPSEIHRMVEALDLDDTIEDFALKIHQQAQSADLQSPDADLLAPALVFAACRLQGAGVGLDELADVAREDRKSIHTHYRTLNRDLGLNIGPNDAETFVERYVEKLDFDTDSRERAKRLVQQAKEADIDAEITAQSLAASILYIVALSDGYDHTQADIQEVTGVAESTLRNHWRNIVEDLEVAVPTRKGMNVQSRNREPEDIEAAFTALDRHFDVPDDLLDRTRDLVDTFDLSGKSPGGAVAGAFWVVARDLQDGDDADERFIVGQAELAHALGVSTSTVQNRAKEFRSLREEREP